jgi:hypothetical protein
MSSLCRHYFPSRETIRKTRDLLERWARWRHYRWGGQGKTVLERFVEGMPGTMCPGCAGSGKRGANTCVTCNGAGRIRFAPMVHSVRVKACQHCTRGEVDGRTCTYCRGSGWRTIVKTEVNPANIHSTYQSPDDPTSQRIDRLVCELRRRDKLLGYFFVIWAEYGDSRGGTQESRAQRLLITLDCYESRLRRAIEWIGLALDDRRVCTDIPFPYKPVDRP